MLVAIAGDGTGTVRVIRKRMFDAAHYYVKERPYVSPAQAVGQDVGTGGRGAGRVILAISGVGRRKVGRSRRIFDEQTIGRICT